MNKRTLNNKTLDALGRRLIESQTRPSPDIDEIISNPRLFSTVNARIAASQRSASSARSRLSLFKRRASAFAGIAMIMIAGFAAAGFLRSAKPSIELKSSKVPEAVPDVVRPETPLSSEVITLPAGRTNYHQPRVEKAVVRESAKPDDRARWTGVHPEPENEFYALSYTGDTDETAGGSRIVRVDVSRSSLFALGVNVPLENDGELVKADLLIGSDGVTRAIRVVN